MRGSVAGAGSSTARSLPFVLGLLAPSEGVAAAAEAAPAAAMLASRARRSEASVGAARALAGSRKSCLAGFAAASCDGKSLRRKSRRRCLAFLAARRRLVPRSLAAGLPCTAAAAQPRPRDDCRASATGIARARGLPRLVGRSGRCVASYERDDADAAQTWRRRRALERPASGL